MRIRLRIWPVAFLAAMTVGSTSDAVFAQRSGRSVAAARQQVRAALLVAIADDKLSPLEERSILRKGKRLLTPAELAGLRRKLDVLSAEQEASPTLASPTVAGKDRIEQNAPDKSVEPIAQTAVTAAGKKELAESVAYNEPADSGDEPVDQADEGGVPASEENPFQDEQPLESPSQLQDLTTMAAEDFPTVAETYGEIAADCGMLAGCFGNFFEGFDAGCCDDTTLISLSTTVDAFKGPMDLDNRNGNFGLQFGVNAGFPLAKRLGIGVQAGTSGVLSDFHGTQFTGSEIRAQNFTTVGLYHRIPLGGAQLKYGFAFDWLYDDYFADLKMSQWRVKLAYDLTPCSEIGIWSCIPDEGDTVRLGVVGARQTFERFKPVAQGNLYFSRCLGNGTALTGWIGLAEEPGQFVFGGDARIPISPQWSFVGNFNYVLPSASDVRGQDEEMWNVSMGIEFTLGRGRNHCLTRRFAPMFPLANNGTFAIRRY